MSFDNIFNLFIFVRASVCARAGDMTYITVHFATVLPPTSMTPSVAAETKEASCSSSSWKQQIKELVKEMRQACHRPLFEEIVGQKCALDMRPRVAADIARKRPKYAPRKSWQEVSRKNIHLSLSL
jgi:hypothetical protein